MSLSNGSAVIFVVVLVIGITSSIHVNAYIACSSTHLGKSLDDAGLFKDKPEKGNKVEFVHGGYIVRQGLPSSWRSTPPYMLGCHYQGEAGMISIRLSRSIRACELSDEFAIECR